MQPNDMEPHDHSLAQDLNTLSLQARARRSVLRWIAVASAMPAAHAASVCALIPEETGGPYPADGSNTINGSIANALALTGVVRRDIRSSFAGSSAVAAGVPLTITLNLVNASCEPLAGYAVYLWHCDRDGNYSMYSAGVTAENYLRGVQQTDSNGQVTFTTIFPGCYAGRMPHVHFEVYPSLAKATTAANRVKTSQFTFPMESLNTVYATAGYSTSVANLARISYASDNVFSDGTAQQMTTVSGTVASGFVASLQVAIAATATSATTFNASMASTGTSSSLSLTGNLTVASADVGSTGSIFVVALVGNSLYFYNGSTWVTASSNFPACYTGTLGASHSIPIMSSLDVSGLCGVPLYVGYGPTASDMVARTQYKLVHTLCQ